jgi:6,7-dimethyl-8-ribityllumazine synthase
MRKAVAGENENSKSAQFFPPRLELAVVFRKKPWNEIDLSLCVQDPDTALQIAKKKKLEILEEYSGPEPSHDISDFTVRLPGGTRVWITGERTDTSAGDSAYIGLEGSLVGTGKHFGIVVGRFNSFITERLLAGAIDCLVRSGVKFADGYDIIRVPGSFEIPSAARTLAETGKYDAIICIGCLLRGDTAHYDVIANEVTRGIGQSAQETGVPHAFGVLTCDTLEQAIDRAGLKSGNKGFEAALAAVEMANLKQAVSTQHSAFSRKRITKSPPAKKRTNAKPRNRGT